MAFVPIAAAASGIFKGATGIFQSRKAKKIRRRAQREFDKHPYETPTEALRGSEEASILATQRDLPGMAELEAGFSGATGGAIEALKETSRTPGELGEGAIEAYERLYVNPLRQARVAGAERQDTNIARAIAAKNVVAEYRDKEYQENIKNPYLRAISAADKLSASGLQNQFSGFSDLLGTATATAELFENNNTGDINRVSPIAQRNPISKPIENKYSTNNLISL